MSSGAGESELLEIYYSPNSATKESWSFKHPNIIGNFFCQKKQHKHLMLPSLTGSYTNGLASVLRGSLK